MSQIYQRTIINRIFGESLNAQNKLVPVALSIQHNSLPQQTNIGEITLSRWPCQSKSGCCSDYQLFSLHAYAAVLLENPGSEKSRPWHSVPCTARYYLGPSVVCRVCKFVTKRRGCTKKLTIITVKFRDCFIYKSLCTFQAGFVNATTTYNLI